MRWTWVFSGTLLLLVFSSWSNRAAATGDGLHILAIFTAAILGGSGRAVRRGARWIVLVSAENLSVSVIPRSFKAAVPFTVLILVLYFRRRAYLALERRGKQQWASCYILSSF